jgi:ribonuclease Z
MRVQTNTAVGLLTLLALLACSQEPCPPPSATGVAKGEMKNKPKSRPLPTGRTMVVMLGTGTPNPHPDRAGPSVAVVVDNQPYIVDCGPGVVRRAQAAFLAGIAGLEASRLDRAFLTHLHSDHTAGYPDLILTPWVVDRKQPLIVYGPPGTTEMTQNILAAYKQDIEVRLEGNQPQEGRELVKPHDVQPGVVHQDGLVEVTAFPVKHGAWQHAYGYRFKTPDRVIVISGDTVAQDSVVEACNGCDVLVHEVYSKAALDLRPPSWQAYHKASHTSTIELAAIANRARPKLLVLYHQLLWGSTPSRMLAEIRSRYDGEVVYANDLDVF